MSSLGSLVVSLSANIGQFTAAMSKANYSAQQNTRAIVKEVGSMRASFDSIPGSIARIVAATGGLYAVGYAFKAGIKAADEFKMSVIGIAAGLTNIAKPGQGDFATLFQRNIVYAEEMNKELMKVAAKTPATSLEMQQGYNQLVQQGYAARLDEAEALGVIVTKIKLATAGQDSNKQINQEIRAVMQGQAVAGSMIAQELETRLGPGWAKIVKLHQESGDLLQWWAKLYPGIAEAGKLYENTLEGQKTTLEDNLKLLGREGLAGAYDDIVGFVKSINDYLRDHGKELAGDIMTGWTAVKEIAGGVVLVIAEIVNWIKIGAGALSGWVSSLNAIAAQRADMGVGMGLDVDWGLGAGPEWEVGGGSGAVASQEAVIAQVKRNNDALAKETARYKKETYGLYLKDMGPVQTQAGAGKGGGGGGKGGGADSTQKEIEKIKKEVEKARKDAYTAENDAFNMVWKLKQDTAAMYADATKNQYEIKGLYKSSYDTLGSISPVMEDQIAYQKKALGLEIEIEKHTLDRAIWEKQIPKAQADELRGLQALAAQAKKFNQEMESDKGIRGWAYGRSKEAEGRNTIKEMMGGLESGFQNAFSSGLQGVLAQEKKTLKDIGKTMFQGLFGEITKGSITKMFDSAAKMLRPATPAGIGGAGNVAGELGDAAKGLQAASVGFNVNTAQFGLAAGGLLLSGIGIATNSQALVYAGAVLQIAGLAIQLYEALTATSTVASMSTAAGALTASAVALSSAAVALGGSASASSGGGILGSIVGIATGFLGLHSGGIVRAHSGMLASDEVPAILQTGERVLSRRQNRDYEAGMGAGGGSVVYSPTYHINAIDARGVDAILAKHGKEMTKVINREVGKRGRRL